MRHRFSPLLILAATVTVTGVGCKPRHDEASSEAKSVNAFSYDGEPKQFLVFTYPENMRSISNGNPLVKAKNPNEVEASKQDTPLTVSEVIAAYNAGTLPENVLEVFPKVDPCASTASDEKIVFLECTAPVETQYCAGRFRTLTKDQYVCALMQQLGQQRLLPNPATLKMLDQQIAAMNKTKTPAVATQITNITDRVQKLTLIMQIIIDLEGKGVNFVPIQDPSYQALQGPFADEKRFAAIKNVGWVNVTGPSFDFSKDPAAYQCSAKYQFRSFKGQNAVLETARSEACSTCGVQRDSYDPKCMVTCGAQPGDDATGASTACR